MNQCIPRKSVSIKSLTPWINREIRNDIVKRERLFRKGILPFRGLFYKIQEAEELDCY